jgi:hypothetical protein
MNVPEILSRTEHDIYLSDNGPNFIEPLTNPSKDIKAALKGFGEKHWEAQFNASSTVRRALRHHQSEITTSTLNSIMEKLSLASDSLRSQVAKNALLALTDLFSYRPYLQNGQIGDAEITQSYSKLLKKAADTNQFLSIEASAALSNLVANTPYAKSIQQLNTFYEEKSVNMRK